MKRRALRGTMPSHSMCGSPCTWQRNPSSAYLSARTMPDLASLSEASTSWVLFPIEETTPMPVTTTRRIKPPSPRLLPPPRHEQGRERPPASCAAPMYGTLLRGCGLFSPLEQSDAQVGSGIDDLPVRLHDAVGNRQLQLAQDHALQIDHVLHRLGGGNHHACEFDLAHAERAALAGRPEPAAKEAGQLPKRIEPQAPGHDGITLEVARPQPIQHGIAANIELGHDLALAVSAPRLRNAGDPIEHEHGRQRQLGVPAAEQLAATAGQQS